MLTRLFVASVRANVGRTALSVAGIALGVALGLAVHMINQSAISEMQQAARTLSGDADLSIRAGRESLGGFDENVFATVLAAPGIAVASPVLELDALPVGAATGIGGRSRQSIHIIGIDIFRAARLQPGFVGELNAGEDRLAALQPGNVLLNRAARELLANLPDKQAGTLQLKVGAANTTLHIAGRVELPQFREPLAVMDIAGAQTVFNQTGRLTRIDLRLQPGRVPDSFRDTLAAQLPPGLAINTPAQTDKQSAAVSRAYRINLTVLSLVALFTGGFLVFSTQGLSVLRRRPQFALYRTLGVTRAELLRALLTEGAVLGAVGGVLGAALGIGIATLVLDKLGGDLGSGFFAGVAPSLQWQPAATALFVLMGIAAGVVGAWLPAREAAAEAPAQALKARDAGSAGSTTARLPSAWLGLGLLLCAVLLLVLPAFDEIPWGAYAAIACLLFGVLALAPLLCARLLAALPRPTSPIAQLAARHIEKSPGPSAAAITGIVASFSLMIAMLIMVVSFRASLEQWLTGVLQADLYARAGIGEANTVDANVVTALAAIEGVDRVDAQRYRSLVLKSAANANLPPVTLIARPMGERRDAVLQALSILQRVDDATLAQTAVPAIWVSEAVADLYGYAPGMKLSLPVEGAAREVIVGGIWRDYARSFGAIVVDRADYLKWTGDTRINDLAIYLKPGASKAAVIAAMHALPASARLDITEAAEIRKVSLSVFDRSFAVTYALEVAAILVGLAGISATFSAQAWARRREFGMLRHLGMTRREIAKLLGMEGALLGLIGAGIGLALGIAIALILVFVVNRQSFHWSMELHMPGLSLLTLSLSLVVLTTISAMVSGRYALSKQAVMAVKDDE